MTKVNRTKSMALANKLGDTAGRLEAAMSLLSRAVTVFADDIHELLVAIDDEDKAAGIEIMLDSDNG